MRTVPTTPIAFYKGIQNLMLEIKYYENLVRSQSRELDRLIKKSGPPAVQSIDYDKPIGQTVVYITEHTILERINQLSHLLPLNKKILAEKKEELVCLRKEGYKTSKKLNDLKLKVFLASFVDGKKNDEIAKEFGYSVYTIFNTKVEINRILDTQQSF